MGLPLSGHLAESSNGGGTAPAATPLGALHLARAQACQADEVRLQATGASIVLFFFTLSVGLRLLVYVPHMRRMMVKLQQLKQWPLLAVAEIPAMLLRETTDKILSVAEQRILSESFSLRGRGPSNTAGLHALRAPQSNTDIPPLSGRPFSSSFTEATDEPSGRHQHELVAASLRTGTNSGRTDASDRSRASSLLSAVKPQGPATRALIPSSTDFHLTKGRGPDSSERPNAQHLRKNLDSSYFLGKATFVAMVPSFTLVVCYTVLLLMNRAEWQSLAQISTDYTALHELHAAQSNYAQAVSSYLHLGDAATLAASSGSQETTQNAGWNLTQLIPSHDSARRDLTRADDRLEAAAQALWHGSVRPRPDITSPSWIEMLALFYSTTQSSAFAHDSQIQAILAIDACADVQLPAPEYKPVILARDTGVARKTPLLGASAEHALERACLSPSTASWRRNGLLGLLTQLRLRGQALVSCIQHARTVVRANSSYTSPTYFNLVAAASACDLQAEAAAFHNVQELRVRPLLGRLMQLFDKLQNLVDSAFFALLLVLFILLPSLFVVFLVVATRYTWDAARSSLSAMTVMVLLGGNTGRVRDAIHQQGAAHFPEMLMLLSCLEAHERKRSSHGYPGLDVALAGGKDAPGAAASNGSGVDTAHSGAGYFSSEDDSD